MRRKLGDLQAILRVVARRENDGQGFQGEALLIEKRLLRLRPLLASTRFQHEKTSRSNIFVSPRRV